MKSFTSALLILIAALLTTIVSAAPTLGTNPPPIVEPRSKDVDADPEGVRMEKKWHNAQRIGPDGILMEERDADRDVMPMPVQKRWHNAQRVGPDGILMEEREAKMTRRPGALISIPDKREAYVMVGPDGYIIPDKRDSSSVKITEQ